MKKFLFAFALVVLLGVSGLSASTGHAETSGNGGNGGVTIYELPSVH
jgi:hypothetical protein